MDRVHSFETFSAVDGPGVRFVVFLQGCPLRCVYCHNPDTWDKDGGMTMSASEIMEKILPYKNFLRRGGVTLSGGEPLLQADFCSEIIDLCHENEIKVAIDTSGVIPLEKAQKAIDKADMLILDIKSIDKNVNKKICGMTNENTFEILDYCEEIGKKIWIRHVLIPDITLFENQIKKLGQILKNYKCIEKVELLPFHKLGEWKWKELQREYSLEKTKAVTVNEERRAVEILKGAMKNAD